MRLRLLIFMSVLATASPIHAQGTGSPGAPRQQPVPRAVHPQPRPSDIPPAGPSTSDPGMSTDNNSPNPRADALEDERLNRILNGICRGC